MPGLFAAAVLALAATATPEFPPESIATIYDGTAVAKPAAWVSLRDKAPAHLRQWRALTGPTVAMELVEMFVDPAALAIWDKGGGVRPVIGRNSLSVYRCGVDWSADPEYRQKIVNVVAQAFATNMRDRYRRSEEAGRKPIEVAFGPSARADRVVFVLKKVYDWKEEGGTYLTALAFYWSGHDCHVMSINGKEEEADDAFSLAARIEHYVEASLEATRKRAPKPVPVAGSAVELSNGMPFFKPDKMVSVRKIAPGLLAPKPDADGETPEVLDVFTTAESLAVFRRYGAIGGSGTQHLEVTGCSSNIPTSPVERDQKLKELVVSERSDALEMQVARAAGTGSAVDAAFGPVVREGRYVLVMRYRFEPDEKLADLLKVKLAFWPGNRCLELGFTYRDNGSDAIDRTVQTLEAIAAKTEALAAAQPPAKAGHP